MPSLRFSPIDLVEHKSRLNWRFLVIQSDLGIGGCQFPCFREWSKICQYTVVNDDVFYTAPSDEGISGITYLTTAQLSDENFMTSAHPNFYSGDPWMWELGGMPRTVMEVFPQYFFQ